MFKYSTMEESKSCFQSVSDLYENINGNADNSFVKINAIERNDEFSEEFEKLVENSLKEVSFYMNAKFNGKLTNRAIIEYHNYEGEDIENFISCVTGGDLDSGIYSFFFYLNREYENGEMIIYGDDTNTSDPTTEDVLKVLDTRTSCDNFTKIIILSENTIYEEQRSTGTKKCIVFHMKYE